MATERLDLRIDVFEEVNQLARVLPDLTPGQLIEAILQEFQELEYLSQRVADYQLLKADDGSPLADDQPITDNGSHLILVETPVAPPAEAQSLTTRAYLRDQILGRVYPLYWQPAIIGRPDVNRSDNDLVAVNLESQETGLRVSRRHAQIIEDAGKFYLESLSNNPTLVQSSAGEPTLISKEKHPLEDGDKIIFERSNITLKFIIRPDKG